MNPKLPDIYDGRDPSLHVALCQVYTEAWDTEGNLTRTLKALTEAAHQGARVAITPECVFHGYGFGQDAQETLRRYAGVAEPLDGPRLAAVRAAAQAGSMYVVVGFLEAGTQGAFHNSAAIISPTGELLDVYRKIHCRNFETIGHGGAFTPGDRFVTTDTIGQDLHATMGTMICFDREIPESTRCLRAMGAQLIACPLACDTEPLTRDPNYAHNEMVTQCRAAENEVFFVVVNHGGHFNGGSFAVGSGGETLVQLGKDAEVRVIELPVVTLQKQVHANAFGWMGWGYRRAEVYARAMELAGGLI